MLSIPNHFLDSNMVLSIAFKDSNFKECRSYYKLKYKRYVSDNVKNEILEVIERMRLIASNVLNHIKKYFTTKNINLSNLDYHIKKIKKEYLNKYNEESFIYGIKKDKFFNIVDNLFSEYYEEIRNTIIKSVPKNRIF